MSYSAFVNCTCFQKGKTTPPPHQEYVQFADDGLNINLPSELLDDNEDLYFEMYSEFDKWRSTACPHEDMEYCYENLSNISGMAAFRSFIHQKDNFPVLKKFLPNSNGGCMPAIMAKELLTELEILENQNEVENKIYLIQKNNNNIIAICNEDDFTIFAFFDKVYKYGLDANGFFMLRTDIENNEEVHYEVFRSKYFSIRKSNLSGDIVVVDEKTARRYRSGMVLTNPGENSEQVYYIVEKRQVETNNYYQYLIEPLKKLAQASLETGNAIHWC
jgi:hypothetical protein